MSVHAYKSIAERTETPRAMEYRLFGEVTRSLMAAAQSDVADVQARVAALHWNRRLWTTLATDCLQDGNQLPIELRAKIVTLSRFVARHTSEVMRREADFEPLIKLNRTIMEGLATRPSSSGAAA